MVSKIGFVLAAAIFLIFYFFLLNFVTGRLRSHTFIALDSILATWARNVWTALFTSEGLPANWENTTNATAVIPGLKTALYRIPLIVNETNGTARTATLNITLFFDESCEGRAWNTTVRVYEGGSEINSSLYNTTFCPGLGNYINISELVFTSTFQAYESKNFSIYFSPDKSILPPNYSVAYSTAQNFSFTLFPEERIPIISVSKLKRLRELSYQEVKAMLGVPYELYVEISSIE